ncbi:hypothetical protein J437_LFUL010385 [Ladona fulva]|uniref:LIM zinc-binding domain-containing protein n=1 Tax=Ladona fulva TaxID=123851 RepID=A0A8K0P458_LADFU|nr:hypothetical protein J437_LFUL010385 [Ladona fulva]
MLCEQVKQPPLRGGCLPLVSPLHSITHLRHLHLFTPHLLVQFIFVTQFDFLLFKRTKKMEYKTRQWHEKCFCCCVCKTPIGTKSFIPREQEIYCATCYEEKFATRCVKCNKIITTGGVTYKNEPWHRECFTCTHCNTSLAGQRFTSRDEKPYCADCFGELFAKRCIACSRPITVEHDLMIELVEHDSSLLKIAIGIMIASSVPLAKLPLLAEDLSPMERTSSVQSVPNRS